MLLKLFSAVLLSRLLLTAFFYIADGSRRVYVALPSFLVTADNITGLIWLSVATAVTSI